MTTERRPHVLVIEQRVPVRLDRRAWTQCQALVRAGFRVSVISPRRPGEPARRQVDGVEMYSYRPAPPARRLLGLAAGAVYAWLRTAWLSVVVWRHRPFDVLQTGNAPDSYWALARLWKRRGVRFVYDQRDLGPELYLSRFGLPRSPVGRAVLGALRWLERRTYAGADQVISPNELYQEIAVRRGHRDLEDSTVVRSAPDTALVRPVLPPPEIRNQSKHLLVHLGDAGARSNVAQLADVMEDLVFRRWHNEIHLVMIGAGEGMTRLRADLATRGLSDYVTFAGRVGPTETAQYLSAADLGLGTELRNPLTDVSSLTRTLDYMAYCLPEVAYDLAEVHLVRAGSATLVPPGDAHLFADEVELLLADTDRRVRMGLLARDRVSRLFDGRAQAAAYVDVIRRLTAAADLAPDEAAPVVVSALPSSGEAGAAGRYVDLEDPIGLATYVRFRGLATPGRATA